MTLDRHAAKGRLEVRALGRDGLRSRRGAGRDGVGGGAVAAGDFAVGEVLVLGDDDWLVRLAKLRISVLDAADRLRSATCSAWWRGGQAAGGGWRPLGVRDAAHQARRSTGGL